MPATIAPQQVFWNPKQVRKLMRARDITVAELIRRLGLGSATVKRWFTPEDEPREMPGLSHVYNIAIAIGVAPSRLDPRLTSRRTPAA